MKVRADKKITEQDKKFFEIRKDMDQYDKFLLEKYDLTSQYITPKHAL